MRILVQELFQGIQVLLDCNEQVIIHVQLLKTESTVQRTRIGTSWRRDESKYTPGLGYLVLPKRPDEARKVHGKSFSATAEHGTSRAFAYKWELVMRLGGKREKNILVPYVTRSVQIGRSPKS